jgi:hypothetical protein
LMRGGAAMWDGGRWKRRGGWMGDGRWKGTYIIGSMARVALISRQRRTLPCVTFGMPMIYTDLYVYISIYIK